MFGIPFFHFYLCVMSTSTVYPIDIQTFLQKRQQNEDLLVIDTRPAADFCSGFIPESIYLGLTDDFEQLAKLVVPRKNEIVVISEEGSEEVSIRRLITAGFDNILGYLSGGIDAWREHNWAADLIIEVEPDELMMDLPFDTNLVVVDVRSEEAYDADHLENAESLPLSKLSDPGSIALIEDHHNVYVLSQSGFRSIIAVSLLKRQGIHNVRSVSGGWQELRNLIK